MAAKHTPGPWQVGEHHGKPAVFDSFPAVVCIAGFVDEHTRDEADANARLIAKAPEMRDLLNEAWIALPESKHNADLNARIKALLAVIDGTPKHAKILHGECPICGHYGLDCTGEPAEGV
jgi:hypothetical protein